MVAKHFRPILVKTVKRSIIMDEDAQPNGGLAWKWLLKVLQQLGIDGIRSEDTDNSNKWLVDDEIYCPQGSKQAH
ncbi:hypothetical protein M422DRAFT_249700 [Sphaerobolus stellatus SS14]|uniref:Uncharacterized protein n=1 Tax=Sphaerobolus stellatus (strain SS14) TaxID=990650 RepID=A0A0C9UV76_SPHS4|nr:hypothetical protein M422DRAFT_249700 [Sphaerobolus stellatus SS14]